MPARRWRATSTYGGPPGRDVPRAGGPRRDAVDAGAWTCVAGARRTPTATAGAPDHARRGRGLRRSRHEQHRRHPVRLGDVDRPGRQRQPLRRRGASASPTIAASTPSAASARALVAANTAPPGLSTATAASHQVGVVVDRLPRRNPAPPIGGPEGRRVEDDEVEPLVGPSRRGVEKVRGRRAAGTAWRRDRARSGPGCGGPSRGSGSRRRRW